MTGLTSKTLVSAPPGLGPHHPLAPADQDALRALQAAQDWPAAYRQIAAYADQNKKITPQVANWLRTAMVTIFFLWRNQIREIIWLARWFFRTISHSFGDWQL
jgi:hypothetical protein